jgi:hypothetical protein
MASEGMRGFTQDSPAEALSPVFTSPNLNHSVTVQTSTSSTTPDVLIFGRYQNAVHDVQPILDWMSSPEWNQFTSIYCRELQGWDTLTNAAKIDRANQAPYRVAMLQVELDPTGMNYRFMRYTRPGEPNPATLFDERTLRTCPLNDDGYAQGLPPRIMELLVRNAFNNLEFAHVRDGESRLIMIDLYPDRPTNTVHGFHTDSGFENADRRAHENLEYVSLMLLSPPGVLTRGTSISWGQPTTFFAGHNNGIRPAMSLMCQSGSTVMFREEAYIGGNRVPSVIHATPQRDLVTGPTGSQPHPLVQTPWGTTESVTMTFNPTSTGQAILPADMAPHPRRFVRIHTSRVPKNNYYVISTRIYHMDLARVQFRPNHRIDVATNEDLEGAFNLLDRAGFTLGGTKRKGTKRKGTKKGGLPPKPVKNIDTKDIHTDKDIYISCKSTNYFNLCRSNTGNSIEI